MKKASTYFCKNCIWMHLKSVSELNYLLFLMREYEFDAELLTVEEADLEKLGHRITVCFRQPGCKESDAVHYLTGENYRKWEAIKRSIYSHRKTET